MNPPHGIVLKILSVTIFTGTAAIIKATADDVPAGERGLLARALCHAADPGVAGDAA
ncbi:MAG: hypothetical protein AAGE13_09970 [Pseudomonadota bacterium]